MRFALQPYLLRMRMLRFQMLLESSCSLLEELQDFFSTQNDEDHGHNWVGIWPYTFDLRPMRATQYSRKRSNTSTRVGWTVGPTSNRTLRDTPVEDLADVSNTTWIFVVELDSL